MWLLLTAAGLLSVICCFNGYIVYRQQQTRFHSQRPLDLQHTVKQWSESSTGQALLLALVLAICVYAAFDEHMRNHPVVLLSFLVITTCSMGGFVSYRYLAYTRTHGTDIVSATTHKARILAKSYSIKWFDEWQLHASYLTDSLVILVGLASFQQAISSFSASTQLIITGCVAMPLCSLSGFLAYVYVHRKQQPVPQSDRNKQNKQQAAAGFAILVAFTIGYIGLKSSIGIPLLIACFALPICCVAGFAMFQYQLYTLAAQSTISQPRQPHQQLVNADDFDDAREEFHYEHAATTQQAPRALRFDDNQEQVSPVYVPAAEVSSLSPDGIATMTVYA